MATSSASDKSKNILRISFAMIICIFINCFLNWLFTIILKVPLLFMDTVGTITMTFIFGGIPGIICAVLSQICLGILNHYFSWIAYFYMLAVFGAVGTICILRPYLLKAKDSFSTIVILILISISMAFAVSLIGGIVNTINSVYSMNHNLNPDASIQTKQLQSDLIRLGLSQLVSNILSRLPGNLIERPVTTFLSFGLYKLYNLRKTVE